MQKTFKHVYLWLAVLGLAVMTPQIIVAFRMGMGWYLLSFAFLCISTGFAISAMLYTSMMEESNANFDHVTKLAWMAVEQRDKAQQQAEENKQGVCRFCGNVAAISKGKICHRCVEEEYDN